MTGHAVVLTTAGSQAEASAIAAALVDRRLAACVNVVPRVISTYRWKGAVQVDEEWLLIVKTRTDRFEAVRSAIRELHSYEQPDVILLPVNAGDEAYLRWIDDNV